MNCYFMKNFLEPDICRKKISYYLHIVCSTHLSPPDGNNSFKKLNFTGLNKLLVWWN